ncbi:hypothetical protein Tco_1115324 [Tanacetum coccineum]
MRYRSASMGYGEKMQSGDDMPLLRTMTDIEQVADTMLLLMDRWRKIMLQDVVAKRDEHIRVIESEIDSYREEHADIRKPGSDRLDVDADEYMNICIYMMSWDRHGSLCSWCPNNTSATSGCYGNGNEFPCLFRVPAKVAGIPVTSHSILLCVERPEEVIWCYKRGWIMGLMAIRFLQCLGLPDQPWVPFGKKTDDNNNNKNNKPICAFDLLAPVDGELLQDGGDKSSGSSNRSFFVSEIISKPPVVQDSYTSVSVLESSADIDSSGRPSLMLCLEIDYMLCLPGRGEYVRKYKTTIKYFQRDVGASNV